VGGRIVTLTDISQYLKLKPEDSNWYTKHVFDSGHSAVSWGNQNKVSMTVACSFTLVIHCGLSFIVSFQSVPLYLLTKVANEYQYTVSVIDAMMRFPLAHCANSSKLFSASGNHANGRKSRHNTLMLLVQSMGRSQNRFAHAVEHSRGYFFAIGGG